MSHGTASAKVVDERVYEVHELTRVEGEGSLRLRVKDGEVVEARLGIFETPRYFEQLVVGRTPDDVASSAASECV
jgi:coenzyme F420-reducing hydrogenase alpha subunit